MVRLTDRRRSGVVNFILSGGLSGWGTLSSVSGRYFATVRGAETMADDGSATQVEDAPSGSIAAPDPDWIETQQQLATEIREFRRVGGRFDCGHNQQCGVRLSPSREVIEVVVLPEAVNGVRTFGLPRRKQQYGNLRTHLRD
jgi:hypothetical protein